MAGAPSSIGLRRPQRPPDRDDGHDRHEDRQLRLDQCGDDRVDRRPLRSVAPQRAQTEQEEDDAERVDLAPQDRVEPAHRVEDGECRAQEGGAFADTDLARHRPDEPADRQVGEDRRDLDHVDAGAERLADDPDHVQDIEIAGRVIVEERPLVEAAETLGREVVRPEEERRLVDPETRPRIELCDDETDDEAEREERDDRADAIPRSAGPRRRVRAPARSARSAAGRHGRVLPERALRWIAG